jgi:cytoskeletal protein RodZ
MSPLGETLQRARVAKGITIEDAERVTRIPRKYLEALEVENYGILPAPVFARGFLRSYAGYLGLDPGELLPFFPVGHVEEPELEPLPEVKESRTWNMSGLIGVGVVGALIVIVVILYSVGREDSNTSFGRGSQPLAATSAQAPDVIVPPEGQAQGGPALALPDLAGQTLEEAIAVVEQSGASYVIVGVREGDVQAGQVIEQHPAPGTAVGAGDVVTLTVSR